MFFNKSLTMGGIDIGSMFDGRTPPSSSIHEPGFDELQRWRRLVRVASVGVGVMNAQKYAWERGNMGG
jgi:hypothetical protein